jgi:hypothetical protein
LPPLWLLYAVERAEHPVYVGQQLDVFINGDNVVAGASVTPPLLSAGGEDKGDESVAFEA